MRTRCTRGAVAEGSPPFCHRLARLLLCGDTFGALQNGTLLPNSRRCCLFDSKQSTATQDECPSYRPTFYVPGGHKERLSARPPCLALSPLDTFLLNPPFHVSTTAAAAADI